MQIDEETYKRQYWSLLIEIENLNKFYPRSRKYRINKLAKLISENDGISIKEAVYRIENTLLKK